MERLKKVRIASGMTQEALAEMLKTTQQTVARWETGKSQPNIAALKDLAVIFQTSVDDLLGRNPLAHGHAVTTNRYHYFARSDEGFWGHLGVLPPGATKSKWYPITLGEANRILGRIANASHENPWVVATTLNNRALVINARATKKLQILDDNADEVAGDWELDWDSYQGYSPEIYKALSDHFLGLEDNECSEDFKAVLRGIIEEHELSEDEVFAAVRHTRVHFKDGTTDELTTADELSWQLFDEVQSGVLGGAPTFDLSCRDVGLDVCVGKDQVAFVDMPLVALMATAAHEREQLEAEEQAHRAVEDAKASATGAPQGRPPRDATKRSGKSKR